MGNAKIAYSAAAWGADNLEKFLDEISEAGYCSIEIAGDVAARHYDKLYLFRQMLSERGLRLVALRGRLSLESPAGQDDEISFNKMAAEFAKSCGGDILVFSGGAKRGGETSDEDIQRLAAVCGEIGEYCKLLGIKACLLSQPGTVVEDAGDIARILGATDPSLVHLCPDTGRLAQANSDPVEIFRRYADRIAYAHFNDLSAGGTGGDSPFCEIGRGDIDFPAIVNILKEIDYEGWITIEINQSRVPPKECAEISRHYLEDVLGLSLSRAGFLLRVEEEPAGPEKTEPAPAAAVSNATNEFSDGIPAESETVAAPPGEQRREDRPPENEGHTDSPGRQE